MFNWAEKFNNGGKALWNGNIVPGMALEPDQVLNIRDIFKEAHSFDQPINNWNISKVTALSGVFLSAFRFNQSVNEWNTENVIYMNDTFNHASLFDQP